MARPGQAGPASRAVLGPVGPSQAGPGQAKRPPSLERRSLAWLSLAQRGVVVQQLRAADAFGLIKRDIF